MARPHVVIAFTVFALVFIAGGSAFPARAASQHAPTLARFAATIHVLRLELDRRPPTSGLARIETELEALNAVRMPDGSLLHTRTPLLADALRSGDRATAEKVRAAVDRLDDTLRSGHASTLTRHDRATLDAVMRDPRLNPHTSFIDSIVNWLGARLADLLAFLNSLGTGGGHGLPLLLEVIIGLCGVAVLGFVVYLAARGALRRSDVDVTNMLESGEPATSIDARCRAAEFATAGQFRNALRYLFLATVLELQTRGELTIRPGLTNRELLLALRVASAGGRGALSGLIDEFDRVWYGHGSLDRAGYDRCEAFATTCLAQPAGRIA